MHQTALGDFRAVEIRQPIVLSRGVLVCAAGDNRAHARRDRCRSVVVGGPAQGGEARGMRHEVLTVWLLINALTLFLVFNTWFTDWASQAIVLLVLEAVFFIVIGLPVFLHQFLRKKKPLKQSLSDSARSVLDFLAGWV